MSALSKSILAPVMMSNWPSLAVARPSDLPCLAVRLSAWDFSELASSSIIAGSPSRVAAVSPRAAPWAFLPCFHLYHAFSAGVAMPSSAKSGTSSS